jgi:hypothetical protein
MTSRHLAEKYDRLMARERGLLPFNTLQSRVQQPHGSVNYLTHISQYRRDAAEKPPLYGFELEIELSPKYHELKILLDKTLGERQYYVVTDGSLRNNGLEIVSLPFPQSEWRQKYSKIHKLLRGLSAHGCKSHDVTTCGLHVAVSGDTFSMLRWLEMQRFINNNAPFFRILSRRERTQFCEFVADGEGSNKYYALNLTSIIEGHDTSRAEFRFFRGTLLPRSFLASLECIFSLVDLFSKKKTAQPTLDTYRKFVAASDYYNLQDNLFVSDLTDAPSKRASMHNAITQREEMAKKKQTAEAKRRQEAIALLVSKLRMGWSTYFNGKTGVLFIRRGDELRAEGPIRIRAQRVLLNVPVGGFRQSEFAVDALAIVSNEFTIPVLENPVNAPLSAEPMPVNVDFDTNGNVYSMSTIAGSSLMSIRRV